MTRTHKAPRIGEGNPSKGPGSSWALTRLGARLGLLDAQRPEKEHATPGLPLAAQPKQDAPQADLPPADLMSLNEALAKADTSEASPETHPSPARPQYAVLEHKRVAIAGFTGVEQKALLDLFHARSSVPVILSHEDAAGAGAAWRNCDLILMRIPPEWAITEPIDPGWLAKAEKPALVFGAKEVLSRAVGMARAGTRDFVALPWTEEDIAWRSAMLLSRAAETPPAQAVPRPGSAAPEVVIAEDDTTTRALLSAMLSRHGMVCHVTDNGGTALELVRRLHPAAVVLDVSMPCLDGFQVLTAIKQDPALASVQVILLTSRQTELDVLQGFGLGADDYMTKPFSPMELAARLKRLIVRGV